MSFYTRHPIPKLSIIERFIASWLMPISSFLLIGIYILMRHIIANGDDLATVTIGGISIDGMLMGVIFIGICNFFVFRFLKRSFIRVPYLKQYGQKINAKCVDVGKFGGITLLVNGKEYKLKSSSSNVNYVVGGDVDVAYNPTKPSDFIIIGETNEVNKHNMNIF